MKKKKSLPDSLELLLDTMCNTFGGIMFIAISLILISQIVSKNIQKVAEESVSELDMLDPVALQRDIQDLELDILKMQQKLGNTQSIAETFTESKEKVRKEYVACRKEVEKHNAIQASLKERVSDLEKKNQENLKTLKKSEQALETLIQNVEEKREELKDNIKNLEERVNQQKKVLAEIPEKDLTFAKEQNTNSTPYFLICKENCLYRFGEQADPFYGEVKIVSLESDMIQMKPIAGAGVTLGNANYERTLERALSRVSRHRNFLYVTADQYSFDLLLKLRRYCRKKGFKTYISCNSDFLFSVGEATYTASE